MIRWLAGSVGQMTHRTMEDDSSFSLLTKNFKKQSFEARSDNHSWNILGFFYPVLHPLLGKCFCQVGGGAQDKDQQAQGSESSADVQGACRDFFFRKSGSL